MKEYIDVLTDVYYAGEPKPDRTGTGTINIFAPREMCFDFYDGFPIVTTKRVAWKTLVWELLWFLNGNSDNQWLKDRGVSIWNEWEPTNSTNLGPIYGVQWRNWNGTDQIRELIRNIIVNPHSRRHIVSAWNVDQLPQMALPPCHMMFQVYVNNTNGISMKVTQRSADLFLGVPFNISSYALLLAIIAQITGRKPHRLTMSFGDAHIYRNHLNQVRQQMMRTPFARPSLVLPKFTTLDEVCKLSADDFILNNYQHHPSIKGEISV